MMMVVVDTRDSTRCVLLFFSKALPGQEHFLVNIDSDAAENEPSEVSSTTLRWQFQKAFGEVA